MEFIRQTTINRSLNSEKSETVTRFKLPKKYYDEIATFPIQAQTIHLDVKYDETTETLSAKPDETVLNRFKEQKSLTEIAGKYENQYKDRYRKFIEIMD
jgi:hypothetical protein